MQYIEEFEKDFDLEGLKKDLEIGFSNYITLNEFKGRLLALIARCESAEDQLRAAKVEIEDLTFNSDHNFKCLQQSRRNVHELTVEKFALQAELKELREQKPVAWRKEHKIDIGIEYSYTSTLSHVEDWEKLGIYLTPLYAAPVAQSRDSAEPVGEISMVGTPGAGYFFNVAWADIADFKVGDKLYRAPQSNANDHIDPFPFIPWSKEAEFFEGAAKSQQSPAVAVPDEIVIDPLDHTKTKIYQRGWNDCRAAMLSAAPQASAERDPLACSGCVSSCFRCRSAQDEGKV